MSIRLPSESDALRLPVAFGKYTLLWRIAKGGMAELYLALHRSMAGFEKLVVIKRILPLLNCEAEFIGMLLHEARLAATLSHPNIVQIYDVGQIDGTYFIAMEHVPGEDLRAIQRQLAAHAGRFPLEHAVAVAVGLCAGLAYAHEKRDFAGAPLNIVHRDISPHNVLVTFSGDVKLIDFGVAKSRLQLGDQTRSGSIKGKIAYMSPEQAIGLPIDHRSDIFALGTTLYELTTGRRPFRGRTDFETLRLVGAASFELPSRVQPGYPPALEAIVLRALAKHPDDRYQSARDLERDLERFVHAAHLRTSQIALSDFMHQLFGEKLRDQEALLAQAKVVADATAERSAAAAGHSRSVPPGAMSVTHFGVGEPRRQGWRGLVGLPLTLAAVAVFSILAMSPRSAWEEVDAGNRGWFLVDQPSDQAGRTSTIDVRPPISTGRLTVNASGGGCRISVDGGVVGSTPARPPSAAALDLELPAGSHTVQCAPSAGRVLSLSVRIDPGENVQVGFVVP